MDKTLATKTKDGIQGEEKINYKAEIAKMFAHMDVVSERINRNQLETEQLQTETRAILAEIKAMKT